MKIKAMAGIILATSLCSSIHASLCDDFSHGTVYLGPSLQVQDLSANQSSFRGLLPRLSLGYADWSNKYYLAAELFVVPATVTLSDIRDAGASSTKASSDIGLSLIPGTLIYKEIWGYLRFGIVSSHFITPNSSKLGLQMGLGLQSKLTSQLALRGEYIYTTYSSVSQVGTPNSNELGLGFIYFFNT